MALCTVIMPVYKSPFLEVAISSILAQSFPDFELLVGLDGPDAAAKAIVEGFDDARIKLFEYEHAGFLGTANKLARMVNTPYLARMDADDKTAANRLEILIAALEKDDTLAGITCDYGYMADNHRNIIYTSSTLTRNTSFISVDNRISGQLRISDPAFVYRTACVAQAGYYDESITGSELPLQFKLLQTHRLAVYDYPLYFHSYVINSVSRSADMVGNRKIFERLLNEHTSKTEVEKAALIEKRFQGKQNRAFDLVIKKIRIEFAAKNYKKLCWLLYNNPVMLKRKKTYTLLLALIRSKHQQFRSFNG
ncbi:MAG: glycosyltransferase family 2 protein [Bacteroidetes bacterium]|nr:MAG: glycosyltransferase family 2 protein [Bacteroidota bacterium]